MNIKHIDYWATGYCKSRKGKHLQSKRKSGCKMRRKVYLSIVRSGMHHLLPDNLLRVRILIARKTNCSLDKVSINQAIVEIKNGNYL